MGEYNKSPQVKVKGYENSVWEGYNNIASIIEKGIQRIEKEIQSKNIIVIDCYPGVDINEIISGLKGIKIDKIIKSDECGLKGQELTEEIYEYITNDRVFGVLTTKKLQDLFVEEKIVEVRNAIKLEDIGLVT